MRVLLNFQIELTEINCGECGGTYAINERYRRQKEVKGQGWYCPYCQCSWGYYGNSENELLKKELAEEKLRKARALADANEKGILLDKAVGSLNRLKRRIRAGVCPCCNRTFQNLAAHIKTKHPNP